MRLRSTSAARTRLIGRLLGLALRPGDCVVLLGPLGTGKTVLVKGIAAGRGIDPACVTSPSFTLVHHHLDAAGVELLHADGFRVTGPLESESLNLTEHPDAILAVEWGDRLQGELPPDQLRVTIAAGSTPHERVLHLGGTGSRSQALLRALAPTLSGFREDATDEPDQ